MAREGFTPTAIITLLQSGTLYLIYMWKHPNINFVHVKVCRCTADVLYINHTSVDLCLSVFFYFSEWAGLSNNGWYLDPSLDYQFCPTGCLSGVMRKLTFVTRCPSHQFMYIFEDQAISTSVCFFNVQSKLIVACLKNHVMWNSIVTCTCTHLLQNHYLLSHSSGKVLVLDVTGWWTLCIHIVISMTAIYISTMMTYKPSGVILQWGCENACVYKPSVWHIIL